MVCSRTTRLDWSPRLPLPRPAPPLTHDTVVVREWHERGAGEGEGGPIALSWRKGAGPNLWLYYAPLVLRASVSFASPCDGCPSGTKRVGVGETGGTIPHGTQLPLIYLPIQRPGCSVLVALFLSSFHRCCEHIRRLD